MSFKICVISCGAIAFQMHGPAYKKYAALHTDTDLAACCDLDEKKAGEFREKFGFKKHYRDYKEMLKEEKPDAVCLNSPAQITAGLAREILTEGYNLIMEKPPGINLEETLSILEAAEKSKVIHQVAFNRRFHPVLDYLVRELRGNYKNEDIHNIGYELYRFKRRDLDFAITAIHGIDTARYIAGSDYKELQFNYQDLPDVAPGAANFYLQGTFLSGAWANLRFCPMTGVVYERAIVNVRDNTYLALMPYGASQDSPGRFFHYRDDKLVKAISGEEISGSSEIFMTNGFYQEISSFFDAVKAGRQPESNLQSSLQSVEVADCMRRRVREYKKG